MFGTRKVSSSNSWGRLLLCASALSIFFPLATSAQEAICQYETTAVGRYYRVMSVTPATDSLPADTVEISQHIQEREAILRAAIQKSQNPELLVYVNPDFIIRIDCPTGWTSLAMDSLVVFPDSIAVTRHASSSDTSWTTRAFWQQELVDSVAGNQYQLTALVFDGDSIVACGGRCPEDPSTVLPVSWASLQELLGDLEELRRSDLLHQALEHTRNTA